MLYYYEDERKGGLGGGTGSKGRKYDELEPTERGWETITSTSTT